MDRLDEVLAVALPLLRRVDELLGSEGAPPEHALWDQLRRVRLLPGDAVRAVAALRPDAFDDAVPALRADARACAEVASGLPPPGDDWSGEAADAYTDLRTRVASHLSGDEESLDERLEASADLAQALIDWMAQARAAVATALAEVLASSEALSLTTSSDPPAAAEVATHVLRVVADAYAEADDLLEGSANLEVAIPM
ncbi:hypothetical protein ACQP2F_01685 [Actinoplanes sp. CA-030573]|uniref:hypothetical protein n=1 Tax=Actinoplanes sp. CA-030573 TaxID=3239898 RepID=UPI003D936FBC